MLNTYLNTFWYVQLCDVRWSLHSGGRDLWWNLPWERVEIRAERYSVMDCAIECCVANVDRFWKTAPEAIDAQIHERSCLEQCGLCWDRAFVLSDGVVATDESSVGLIASAGIDASDR